MDPQYPQASSSGIRYPASQFHRPSNILPQRYSVPMTGPQSSMAPYAAAVVGAMFYHQGRNTSMLGSSNRPVPLHMSAMMLAANSYAQFLSRNQPPFIRSGVVLTGDAQNNFEASKLREREERVALGPGARRRGAPPVRTNPINPTSSAHSADPLRSAVPVQPMSVMNSTNPDHSENSMQPINLVRSINSGISTNPVHPANVVQPSNSTPSTSLTDLRRSRSVTRSTSSPDSMSSNSSQWTPRSGSSDRSQHARPMVWLPFGERPWKRFKQDIWTSSPPDGTDWPTLSEASLDWDEDEEREAPEDTGEPSSIEIDEEEEGRGWHLPEGFLTCLDPD